MASSSSTSWNALKASSKPCKKDPLLTTDGVCKSILYFTESSDTTDDSAEFKNTKLRTVYPEKTPTWKSYKIQIFISLPLFPTCPTALRSGTRKSVGNKLELEILVVWGVLNREDQESINYYLHKLTMQMEKQNSWDCLVSHNQNIDILFIYLFEREQTREKKAARRSDFLAFSSSLSLGYLALPSLFKGG